ncbi:MAG: hypothetical protein ACT4OI_11140 [Methanobacteriota archaeon]
MKTALRDFLAFFLVPWGGSTIALVALMWWRDPTSVRLLGAGILVSLVFGVFCFLAYLTYGGKVRIGPWRDFL